MNVQAWLHVCVLITVVAPAALCIVLGTPMFLLRPLHEHAVGRLTRATMLVMLASSSTALGVYLASDVHPHVVSWGAWFTASGSSGFRFAFLIDELSLGFAVFAAAVSGAVAAFSYRYLHREPGYQRYFLLFAMFAVGITLIALAGSIEVLFAGWELVGLSSALLVGFFHERRAPVENALRVFAVYRVSDAAMLSAVVLLHHWAGSGSLSFVFLDDTRSSSGLSTEQITVIALLLLAAVAGKSALLPFSGWLPRAMEGPTPSSAVYYGALSIHAGCFLLLRAYPLLAQSPLAVGCTAFVGVATAAHATLTARVQSDVKSALAYAALTQVGIIVVEIACGLRALAFVHMIAHACFRLLQFMRAPNAVHELHDLVRASAVLDAAAHRSPGHEHGEQAPTTAPPAASAWRRRFYLFALERGFVDAWLDRIVVVPFCVVAGALDRFDRVLCGVGRAHANATPSSNGRD